MSEEIEGTVEKLFFVNEENGYAVVRLDRDGESVVAVGTILSPAVGQRLRLKGAWTKHPRFGRQFRFDECSVTAPITVEGIESYLSSGLIPGIGPRLAGSMVQTFGMQTLEVLDVHPEQLGRIPGIGAKRLDTIRKAWAEQRGTRETMVFLQSYGVGLGLAARIYKQYGARTIRMVEEDPYRLAREIPGIGFLIADRIAVNLGLPRDSISRAQAGILHTLSEANAQGHVYLPRLRLIQDAQKTLQIDREIIGRALDALQQDGRLVIETFPDSATRPVYLPSFHRAEKGVAELLRRLLEARPATPTDRTHTRRIDPDKALEWVQRRMNITLAPKQEDALRTALTHRAAIITGGPGTGKTTIIRSLLAVLEKEGRATILAAPTGRAAKRLKETSGHDAATIHRLLEYSPGERRFRRNREYPLACDTLILDETSMVDIRLMYRLLLSLPRGVSLILVGDADQLPSVGPGCVLKDLILSGVIPVVELTEVHRQAEASRIVVNAHRINIGLTPLSEPEGDFYFIEQEDPNRISQIIVELCRDRIPRRFNLDPVNDIQVLSPMRRGEVGVTNLNRLLQQTLNPPDPRIGEGIFKASDKVMQTRNNYDKDVYNGDIGRVERVDPGSRSASVRFDDRRVRYEGHEVDELVLAYAISVHKSQGSEFPAVVVPVVTQHYMLLQRNLIYTAVSRGKKLVVLIGSTKALRIAVGNTDTGDRFSMLKHRLSRLKMM